MHSPNEQIHIKALVEHFLCCGVKELATVSQENTEYFLAICFVVMC